ncbi:hypothetical protein DPMN_068806 [Dreissena polymorpha]|uniref:Uncharacterized protein n=1 Tax=Dreissena polymorpha TaxID=45954 RepID=A0A9D3Z0E7_DREPO|nr:hypothetical protein DPMN_068806 [Dreissena polymorpha]
MKVIVFLLLTGAACVIAEQCTTNTDCQNGGTRCATGYHVICEHTGTEGVTANGGLCTCAADDTSCRTRADCLAQNYTCISNDHKHCYDGKCICSRW